MAEGDVAPELRKHDQRLRPKVFKHVDEQFVLGAVDHMVEAVVGRDGTATDLLQA